MMTEQPENEKIEKETKSDKHKLSWYQYSLRSLLIVMFLFCILFAWGGYKIRQAEKQKEAVAWVEKMGGSVVYDYQYDEKGNWNPMTQPPGPDWLREWIGVDYFCDVYEVNYLVVSKSIPDRHLEDLYPLVSLTHLRVLALTNSQVSNLSSLESLTNLERLYLSSTLVTKEEVQKLQLALPNCKIHWYRK